MVAVSGGVDSVVLLHLLTTSHQPSAVSLVVAHFDHGMRPDSAGDRRFVQSLAEKYGLPFRYETGQLGSGASEATAREVRYAFLRSELQTQGAQAILTAHHQDDALETAVINMLRGTGRKGLTSLRDQADVRRPLLRYSKQDILDYARRHQLSWREDSSNHDQTYLRNYVRHSLLPKLSAADRKKLLALIVNTGETNQELDALLDAHLEGSELNRAWFAQLPHDVAREVMASWLRHHAVRNFDRKSLERLVVGAKVARPGAQLDVAQGWTLSITHDNLALCSRLDLEHS